MLSKRPNADRNSLLDLHQILLISSLSWHILLFPVQDLDEETLHSLPLIYCHFAHGIGDSKYFSIDSWSSLSKLLEEALEGHNEMNAVMNLVLFEDAMRHV